MRRARFRKTPSTSLVATRRAVRLWRHAGAMARRDRARCRRRVGRKRSHGAGAIARGLAGARAGTGTQQRSTHAVIGACCIACGGGACDAVGSRFRACADLGGRDRGNRRAGTHAFAPDRRGVRGRARQCGADANGGPADGACAAPGAPLPRGLGSALFRAGPSRFGWPTARVLRRCRPRADCCCIVRR